MVRFTKDNLLKARKSYIGTISYLRRALRALVKWTEVKQVRNIGLAQERV